MRVEGNQQNITGSVTGPVVGDRFDLSGATGAVVKPSGTVKQYNTHIRSLYTPTYAGDEMEGYVVRLADGFSYGAFRHSVAKYVRADHIRTRPHWFHGQPVIPNQLQQAEGKSQ